MSKFHSIISRSNGASVSPLAKKACADVLLLLPPPPPL
jgi:hypothetical protein